MSKGGLITRVHVDATWHSQPRGQHGRLRGADVTWRIYIYYIYFNNAYRSSAYQKMIITSSKLRSLYTRFIFLISSVWD